MSENKYLPIGTKIANKYEIIDILGEDEFELLYLVKAIGRKGSFFVAKELFLETFSFREQNYVSTVVEARGVFNKRKKQIIEEFKILRRDSKHNDIRIYGYEEENDTIYTIMDFSSNASIERYLQFTPKENTVLPELKQLSKKDKKGVGLFFIFGLFLIFLTLGATIFYAYKFLGNNGVEVEEKFIESKEVMLKEHTVSEAKKIVEQTTVHKPIVSKNTPEKVTEKPIIQTPIIKKTQIEKIEVIAQPKKVAEKLAVKIEENKTIIAKHTVPKVEKSIVKKTIVKKNIDKNISTAKKLPEIKPDSEVKVEPKVKEVPKEKKAELTAEQKIEKFLHRYIHTISTASANKTLHFYDKKLTKYFRFKNATHKTIAHSQKRYNEKWTKRDFKISDFKIVKHYRKKGVNYYNLKTTTTWHVSNAKGKKRSGKSRGFMRLKEVDGGFKIITIYSLK